MGVFKEIAKADGSGTTTFYRLSSEEDTVETTSTDGTTTMIDYNSMLNKPSINDVALVGNKTLEDLGIQPAGDYLTAVPEEYITEEELEAKDYATEAFVMEQINNTEHFHREIVDALPLTGKDNVLYLVPKKGSDKDIYNEYIWTGADYEFMGTTAVDLTDYYQKNEVDELLGTKVNKVSGKQLSTNDYTTAEKTKLASLENYDDGELRSKVDALHNYDDTAVKLDIQELKRDTSTNEIDITSIENELGYKAEVIRLVKNGDWWLCQDAKGNNLTLEMAMNRLGLPKTILLLENLENDGKYYPVEYKLQEKYIDIIYKDLEGITHHLNYGYNEYFTNTASGDYIHLEDSINYPYKELSVDGVCEQKTTTGKNLLPYPYAMSTSTINGVTITDNGNGYLTINGTSTGTVNFLLLPINEFFENGTYIISLENGNGGCYLFRGEEQSGISGKGVLNETITLANNTFGWFILQIPSGMNFKNLVVKPMIRLSSIENDTYEPYTGGQPSPSPDYPQEIKTIENSLKITSCNKNLFNVSKYLDNNYVSQKLFIPVGEYTVKYIGDTSNGIYVRKANGTTPINGTPIIERYNINQLTFTITESGEYYIQFYKSQNGFTLFENAQLEKGTNATPYEQHLETQIQANLPDGEFIGKINDTYKDTLKVEYNEEDGQYHLNLYKNVGKGTLILANTITHYNNNNWINFSKPKNSIMYENFNRYPLVMKFAHYSENNYELYSYQVGLSNYNAGIICKEDEDISALKEIVDGSEYYYPLAESYVVDLGIVDMPTTYNGVTNLYTDSDLIPTINVEYYTEILENAKDNIIGQDIYLQDEVDTLNDLPTKANKGDIRKVKDTESWYIYDGTIWSAFDKASEIDLTNYLSKDNTIPYAPSTDYNPATKRYVDTKINDLFIPTKTSQLTNDSGFVLKSVNDLTNYYNKSNTYNKAEVNALVAGGGGGSNVSITVNGDTLVITTK